MAIRSRLVTIPCAGIVLAGEFGIPEHPAGIIAFVHGSGSSRTSPRNRFVAEAMQQRGFATLLFDLLTPAEAHRDALDATLRFDVDFLADRLVSVTDWLIPQRVEFASRIGYFGASTGAAAALLAAARRPNVIRAIVSRGGRPDLAGSALAQVRAPTLLLVGGHDHGVIELNEAAAARLPRGSLQIIPGATHLFEEPGALERVAESAGDWFQRYLVDQRPAEIEARP